MNKENKETEKSSLSAGEDNSKPMTAEEVLEDLGIEGCRECHCNIGDDWTYKDFSNKNIIICPQCGEEYNIEEEEERLDEEYHKTFYFSVHGIGGKNMESNNWKRIKPTEQTKYMWENKDGDIISIFAPEYSINNTWSTRFPSNTIYTALGMLHQSNTEKEAVEFAKEYMKNH